MSSVSFSGDNNLAGASLCLLPATSDLQELLAGALAEHNLLFERRGRMLALLGPGEPSRAIELLRNFLNESERNLVAVASIGLSGFPELRSLDEWWKIRQTEWFETAMANPFASDDPESRGAAFSIWFQPTVDTSNNRILAHECMARVYSGSSLGRRYSGAEILDAAWLRRTERQLDGKLRSLAITTAAKRGGSDRFFINILPNSLPEPALCLTETFAALRKSGLPPHRFVFEVVNATGNEPAHLNFIAEAVRQQGCGLSLDDLGVSSGGLQLLQDLRPDYVKLCPSLISDVESSACASAIRRIVEVADRCGTTVIAKNVENSSTVENLWLLGVQVMQGYFFGRPAPTPVNPQQDLLRLASALEGRSAPEGRSKALQYCN